MRKSVYPPGTKCSVDCCDRLRRKREWCDGHYGRIRKHGDPLLDVPLPPLERSEHCIVQGCGGELHARQLCTRHYNQTVGITPLDGQSAEVVLVMETCSYSKCTDLSDGARFCTYHHGLSKRSQEDGPFLLDDLLRLKLEIDGCWIRSDFPDRCEYNMIRVGTRQRGMHRISYALAHGLDVDDLDEDMVVMHKCDNPPFFNPNHLELGSLSDNMMDASNKGRLRFGERNYFSKMSNESVTRLREKWDHGSSARELAEEFGVHIVTVYDIAKRKTWSHI